MAKVRDGAALNTGMCEFEVLKQTYIKGVELWQNRPIINGPYLCNTHHE